jgi:hypothetical protein
MPYTDDLAWLVPGGSGIDSSVISLQHVAVALRIDRDHELDLETARTWVMETELWTTWPDETEYHA